MNRSVSGKNISREWCREASTTSFSSPASVYDYKRRTQQQKQQQKHKGFQREQFSSHRPVGDCFPLSDHKIQERLSHQGAVGRTKVAANNRAGDLGHGGDDIAGIERRRQSPAVRAKQSQSKYNSSGQILQDASGSHSSPLGNRSLQHGVGAAASRITKDYLASQQHTGNATHIIGDQGMSGSATNGYSYNADVGHEKDGSGGDTSSDAGGDDRKFSRRHYPNDNGGIRAGTTTGASSQTSALPTHDAMGGGLALRGKGCAGLWNLGNTCFMNAIVQCLCHTEAMLRFFTVSGGVDDAHPHDSKHRAVHDVFHALVLQLWAVCPLVLGVQVFPAQCACVRVCVCAYVVGRVVCDPS